MTLSNQDPRLPFVLASVALLLTGLALAKIERTLAKDGTGRKRAAWKDRRPHAPAPIFMFGLATVILAIGFQLHLFLNSQPLFKKFASDTTALMQVFWVGFSIGMFPASLITKRWGGLPVMGAAGLVGAIAIVPADVSNSLGN